MRDSQSLFMQMYFYAPNNNNTMPRNKTKNNKAKQSKNQNRNKSKNNSQTVNVRIAAAPVARGTMVTRRRSPTMRNTKGGSVIVRNHTMIEITKANNTGTHTQTINLKVGDSTAFPFLSEQVKIYDKVKWRKCNFTFVSALPTTAGGIASMYMDSDVLDTVSSTVNQAMQNEGCKSTPIWKNISYNATKKFLRPNEMFTTTVNTAGSVTTPPNTFTSPARFHVITSPLSGVTFTTSTVVGHLIIDYEVELLHPSQEATTVPARVRRVNLTEVDSCSFDNRLVEVYDHFMAGAMRPVSFWRFLYAIKHGLVDVLINECDVDEHSRDFQQFTVANRFESSSLSIRDLLPYDRQACGSPYSELLTLEEESEVEDLC